MKNRICNIDLAKFISSLLIMATHLTLLTDKYTNNYWLYVEFFLIISGYFTAKHFDNKDYNNPLKESIIYTLKKYISFFPYILIANISMYALMFIPDLLFGNLRFRDFLFNFTNSNFIYDVLMITESYSNCNYLIGPLWFLSALLIVLPIFSCTMQIKNRYGIIMITSMYSLFYYGAVGVIGKRTYPHDFLRVLAGLCLGAFVYEIMYIFNDYIKNINKLILTIIELFTFLFPIVAIYLNKCDPRLVLFCFTVCLAIMLPNLSYTSKIKGKLFTYLGKLSMVLFIIHWVIGSLLQYLINSNIIKLNNDLEKVILFYGVTIIIAMIIMYIIDHWKWYQKIIRMPLILKD